MAVKTQPKLDVSPARRRTIWHASSRRSTSKGGVGKTTTTVSLAEFLSVEFGRRVLVIDLDPQTNATLVLIGEERWRELNAADNTLAALFRDAVGPEGAPTRFDLQATLQRGVSAVDQVRNVDLLPSSLDLIDVQDRLATMSSGRFFSSNPTDLLRPAIKPIVDSYDYVLIDCPPNLGIVTLNGLRVSDGYIVPTIPDHLSTYGIPQIQTRAAQFASGIGENLRELGIVVTKYRAASTVHSSTVKRLIDDPNLPRVFQTVVPEGNAIAASAQFTSTSTLRQKYGDGYKIMRSLAEEFVALTEEIA